MPLKMFPGLKISHKCVCSRGSTLPRPPADLEGGTEGKRRDVRGRRGGKMWEGKEGRGRRDGKGWGGRGKERKGR